ncbi:uncharacterized protein JCM10292_005295 [Rhodotorula paludigena]|uniref:uncharacterized protein n=1 Tax=Rhodotorula paludigena TaxID=86838 RepID=UPI003180F408
MSTCSFASYLYSQGYCSPLALGAGPAALQHAAPAHSGSLDAASPHKRQRNHSPDSADVTATVVVAAAADPSPLGAHDVAMSYFAGAVPLSPASSSATLSPSTAASSLPTTAAPSPVCPVKSILLAPSSPSSTVPSSPFSSPPSSRPVSRRSSTSKSVRFARCTNASVFPTHSTADYDRSPIVPTCESESLEMKRCKSEGEDGEWVQCQAREKASHKDKAAAAAAAAAAAHEGGYRLPRHAPAMENPVEGVHGLIEGGFFVGEERDHPAFPATTPPCGSLGVHIPEVVAEQDETLADAGDDAPRGGDDDDDELFVAGGEGGVDDEGELMLVDDSAESDECGASGADAVPHLVRDDSASGDDSSSMSDHDGALSAAVASSASLAASAGRSSPDLTLVGGGGAAVDRDEDKAKVAAAASSEQQRKKKFGLCALGKWSRYEVFQCHDSLSGFA